MSFVDVVTALAQAIGFDVKRLRRHSGYNVGGVISGVYYDNSQLGMTNGTMAAVAERRACS